MQNLNANTLISAAATGISAYAIGKFMDDYQTFDIAGKSYSGPVAMGIVSGVSQFTADLALTPIAHQFFGGTLADTLGQLFEPAVVGATNLVTAKALSYSVSEGEGMGKTFGIGVASSVAGKWLASSVGY